MHIDARGAGLRAQFKEWLNADAGVTAIEYALIAFLVAVIIISAVTYVGAEVKAAYEYVANCVKNLSCQ
jgi:pilus assembly protein Flp/PilA